MTKRITEKLNVFILSLLLVFCFSIGVKAETKELTNQLTILYQSENHDFSELDIDSQKIQSVESVSDTIDVVHFKSASDAAALIEKIEKNEGVKAVDYEAITEIEAAPNDKHYETYQSYLKNLGYENVVPGDNTVKVAVVDTGVNADHVDLTGRVEESGYNYIDDNTDTKDKEGHGTFVSGIISAHTNNEIGIAGVSGTAPVLIVPYVTLDEKGEGELSGIAAALEDIANRDDIKVVNLSLGFDNPNAVLEAQCQELMDKGKILICSSGNYGGNELLFPAGYESTISVGAVNASNERCTEIEWGEGYGSNYGEGLDLMAPGNEIASLLNHNEYTLGSGTSYSAPIVSAACAVAATRDPNLNFNSAREYLHASALDLETAGWDPETGYGLVQLDAFINNFAVTGLHISGEKTLEINKFDNYALTAELEPAGAFGSIVWSSNNDKVATVDENGNVNAVGIGECVITAECQGQRDTIRVKVNDAPQPIYRLYNAGNHEHLYTSDINEVRVLTGQGGWINEDVAWNAPSEGEPVYRLNNDSVKEHLYTKDTNEVEVLKTRGWTVDNDEKPLFYSGGDRPIYRLYHDGIKRHLLTSDAHEYQILGTQGWDKENIALNALN